jgi:predicted RNase H-like HicB family nuclease
MRYLLGGVDSPISCEMIGSAEANSEDIMKLTIECEQETDGRWLAEVPELPGVLAYGSTADEAMARAQVLALRVMAERLEHGEARAVDIVMSVPAAA